MFHLHRVKLPVLIGDQAVLSKQVVNLLDHCTKRSRAGLTPGLVGGGGGWQPRIESHHHLPVALWSCSGQNLRPLRPETESEASEGTLPCLVSLAKKQRGWFSVTLLLHVTGASLRRQNRFFPLSIFLYSVEVEQNMTTLAQRWRIALTTVSTEFPKWTELSSCLVSGENSGRWPVRIMIEWVHLTLLTFTQKTETKQKIVTLLKSH